MKQSAQLRLIVDRSLHITATFHENSVFAHDQIAPCLVYVFSFVGKAKRVIVLRLARLTSGNIINARVRSRLFFLFFAPDVFDAAIPCPLLFLFFSLSRGNVHTSFCTHSSLHPSLPLFLLHLLHLWNPLYTRSP